MRNIPKPIRENLGYDAHGDNPDLLLPADRAVIMSGGVRRTGGAVLCRCGLYYHQHPCVQGALYLLRTCEGIVKL